MLAMVSVALTDQQRVQTLTEGLRSWQHQAAVMSTNPANVAAFYVARNKFLTSLVAPATEEMPRKVVLVDSSTSLVVVADKLVNDLADQLEKIVIGKIGGDAGYGGGASGRGRVIKRAGQGRGSGEMVTAPAGRFVPMSDRKCFNCDVKGHLAKDCPSPQK